MVGYQNIFFPYIKGYKTSKDGRIWILSSLRWGKYNYEKYYFIYSITNLVRRATCQFWIKKLLINTWDIYGTFVTVVIVYTCTNSIFLYICWVCVVLQDLFLSVCTWCRKRVNIWCLYSVKNKAVIFKRNVPESGINHRSCLVCLALQREWG